MPLDILPELHAGVAKFEGGILLQVISAGRGEAEGRGIKRKDGPAGRKFATAVCFGQLESKTSNLRGGRGDTGDGCSLQIRARGCHETGKAGPIRRRFGL